MRQITDSLFVGLLEAAPDAMVCVDAGGRIALVNAQAERLFGYGRQELAGQPVEVLVPDAARAGHPALRAGYAADPRPRAMGEGLALSGRRCDGSTFPAEISLSALDTDDGMLIMAAVRDVTRQRESAEAAARLAAIINSSNDAVIGQALGRVVTSWNPAAMQLYGYTEAEMVGRHIDILIPAGNRAAEYEIQAAVIRGERVEPYQAVRVRKDGTVIEVSVMLSPIADQAGTIIGVARVSRDVSTQQRADARFRGLLEAAPDAMVCVDAGGRIALVNAQAERLFGYGRQELAGQPVEVLVPDAARAGHPALRAGYAADPRPRAMGEGLALSGRRRDGSTFPAEISLSAIDTQEGILVTAAVRDVSERQRLQAEHDRLQLQAERDRMERQLQQSQRMESLGQLAGGVAHDFNNILNVILNYARFVREEVTKEPAQVAWPEVREYIGEVEEAATLAAQLTRQLLTFGRREVSEPRPLVLDELVAGVERLLARTLGEHVELRTDLAAASCAVLADPGQIEQVLVNLAVNARDAMPGGGRLAISTACTEVDAAGAASWAGLSPGRFVSLKVSDTGTGMPAEVAARAFEPFFTTKARHEGSGLGLATVYGIITQAKGFVQIYSEPGAGTTVAMLMPATSQAAVPSPPLPQQTLRGGGETVLVAEDQAASREVTRLILARNGYVVITATNGLEAVEAAAAHPGGIDVLLTDVMMPKMLGKEAAERIRAACPAVKVLFMSGYTDGVLDNQGVLESGVDLIGKPFTEESLLARLREIIAPGAGQAEQPSRPREPA